MYVLTCRVGGNFGIVDTEDGCIEWLDGETVRTLLYSGVNIEGISRDGSFVKPITCMLAPEACNWVGGENIFKKVNNVFVSPSGNFTFKVGSKVYKGCLGKGDYSGCIVFSFNVAVPIIAVKSLNPSFFCNF